MCDVTTAQLTVCSSAGVSKQDRIMQGGDIINIDKDASELMGVAQHTRLKSSSMNM